MGSLLLHEFHQARGAQFLDLNGQEGVANYGNLKAEYAALNESAAVIDGSFQGRLCLLGADRVKFLNGQVTNNVKDLRAGEGCYAALVSAKGKIQSDLHIYILENEILLEFEPGLTEAVQQRLEKYIIAEDAQVADVSQHYGLWSVQGPKAGEVLKALPFPLPIPQKPNASAKAEDSSFGEIYVTNRARTRFGGYDIYVPVASMQTFADQLLSLTPGERGQTTCSSSDRVNAPLATANEIGGCLCGWQALEIARIEAGIPRFGVDMDESNLASEVLGSNAISYSKGCYIGQEVIARVRTYGQVAKALRGLRLPDNLAALPVKNDKLFLGEKEAGYITSATASPRLAANIGLGYVRREANQIGAELSLHSADGKVPVKIVELPFTVSATA